jgi:hypothetical protein
MGNRYMRKHTRQVKAIQKQEAINDVIRIGLKGGESFRDITSHISMEYHLNKNEAVSMVMQVYKTSAINKTERQAV